MSSEAREVDVAILGAGTAGLSAWRTAKRAGLTALMCDPGPHGTTCARVGCMPSKLLIAAANAAHHARHTAQFGVHTGEVRVDDAEVMARVQSERDRFVGFVMQVIDEARDAGELLEGRAAITGPGTLQVEGQGEVRFKRLVLATGSRPTIPKPYQALPPELLLTSDTVFELKTLPARVLVVGLGVIGLELGQALHRLGVKVTLLGMAHLIANLTDPTVRDVAREVLSSELDLHSDHTLQEVRAEGDGVLVRFLDASGNAQERHIDRVLIAAGRRPNLDTLGLDTLGITPDERGRYPIDPGTLQLGDEPIFVAGDANGLHPVLHEASDDGRRVADNATHPDAPLITQRRTKLGIAFCDPQLAVVGKSYDDLSDCEASAGQVSFADQGRARVEGVNRGVLRVYGAQETGQLLGAELCGPQAEHLAHLLAWVIQRRLTVSEVLELPFYHPVLEEGLRTALRDLSSKLRHREGIKCGVTEHGVGC